MKPKKQKSQAISDDSIREQLINAGVKNLKEFGYPSCDKENILKDYIYSQLFKSMLKENAGHGEQIDKVIGSLTKEIEGRIQPKL